MIKSILQQPLAITHEALDGIINAEIPSAILSKPAQRVEGSGNLKTRDGVGIIDIKGQIFSDRGLFSYFSDMTSAQSISSDFQKALSDDDIESILFNIDSPGGASSGISELANMIYNARGEKPIIAYIYGQGGSAAYWIAAAADEVIISDTGIAGSIGVVLTTYKKSDEEIRIVAALSPKKAPDPGNKEGLQQYLDIVNPIAEVFVENVAKFRGVSVKTVEKNYGQGGVFVGKHAVSAGLADKLGTLEGAFREFQTNTKFSGGRSMKVETVEQLTTSYPDLVKSVQAAAISGVDVQSQIDAEKTRIFGLAKAMGGDGKLEALVNSGVTLEQYEAIKCSLPKPKAEITPQKVEEEPKPDKQQVMLDALKASGAPNPGTGFDGDDTPKDFNSAVESAMRTDKISRGAAIKKIANEQPELHDKYIEGLR